MEDAEMLRHRLAVTQGWMETFRDQAQALAVELEEIKERQLFKTGQFRLASGQTSYWKVECDAFTDDDWAALARIAVDEFKLRFSHVVGVPTGGERFARALSYHAEIGHSPVLVVDDVWTTGASLQRVRAEYPGSEGLVAFARSPITDDTVRALWTFGA